MLLIRLVNLPRSYQSAFAIGLVIVALAVPLLLFACMVSALIAQTNEIADLRLRAGKLAPLAALRDEALKLARLPAQTAASGLLIEAENLPIARANLQTLVNAIVAAHGGLISSSGDVPDIEEKALLLIGMRGDISGTNETMARMLAEIESHRPPLLVRELLLRAEGSPPPDLPTTLTASIRLYGVINPVVPTTTDKAPEGDALSNGAVQ